MLSYHSKQIGAALLIILAIIVLGMTAFLLTRLNNTPLRLEDQAQTALALAEAKAALLGFASTYAENHAGQPQGYLPCPDFNGDGSSPNPWGSDTSCGQQGKSVIGRLPWRTLGLPALRDGSGECLWYAISGSYKDRPKTTLTSDSNGLFYVQNAQGDTIAGTYPSNQAIAIIFSPGKLIGNQDRSLTDTETECGSVKLDDPINNPSNYLDVLNNVSNGLGGDASSGGTFHFDSKLWTTNTALQPSWFVQSQEIRDSGNQANVIFNDTIMVITPNDFTPVYRRMDTWVAARVRDCLEEYAQQSANKYPWLSSIYPADYTEDDEQRFGRIPQAPLTQTNLDDNNMQLSWPRDPNFTTPDLTNQDLATMAHADLLLLLEQLGLTQTLLEELDLTDLSQLSTEQLIEKLTATKTKQEESERCFSETDKKDKAWQWGWWWSEWKDKVFIAIGGEHSPIVDSAFKIKSNDIFKEVIILVAGRMINGQARNTETEQTTLSNYLEVEVESINNDGDNYHITGYNATFNDTVVTIP